MIDYDREEELTYLSPEEKLEIVKTEIEKIIGINNLCFDALRFNREQEIVDGYLFAVKIIDKASWNIRKMFPYQQ